MERVSHTTHVPVSHSSMDDLWRALSSAVIGRHVCSQCGNESRSKAGMSQDLCGLLACASGTDVRDAKGKKTIGR